MDNPTDEEYESAKEKASVLYVSHDQIWSEVLSDHIAFDSVGFRHLMQKKGIFRTKKEQVRRFNLVHDVPNILNADRVELVYEKRKIKRIVKWNGKKQRKDVDAKYWIFAAKYGDRPVKLVIRQFHGGKKHFLSVYEVG